MDLLDIPEMLQVGAQQHFGTLLVLNPLHLLSHRDPRTTATILSLNGSAAPAEAPPFRRAFTLPTMQGGEEFLEMEVRAICPPSETAMEVLFQAESGSSFESSARSSPGTSPVGDVSPFENSLRRRSFGTSHHLTVPLSQYPSCSLEPTPPLLWDREVLDPAGTRFWSGDSRPRISSRRRDGVPLPWRPSPERNVRTSWLM
jgi:hypothetical protein